MFVAIGLIFVLAIIIWFLWTYAVFDFFVVKWQDRRAKKLFKFFTAHPDVHHVVITHSGTLDIYFKEGEVGNPDEPFSPNEFLVESGIRQDIYKYFGSW